MKIGEAFKELEKLTTDYFTIELMVSRHSRLTPEEQPLPAWKIYDARGGLSYESTDLAEAVQMFADGFAKSPTKIAPPEHLAAVEEQLSDLPQPTATAPVESTPEASPSLPPETT